MTRSSHEAPDYRALVQEFLELRAKVEALASTPRLANASIDDGYLPITEKGKETARIGRMPDGSFGTRVTSSPPQPTCTPPVLNVLELGAMEVMWDGGVVLGYVPEVHGRTEVWTAYSEDGTEPPLSAYHLASSIFERDGGTTTVICPAPGTWFVRFQMVGADDRTRGNFSEASFGTIVAQVDAEAIEEHLREQEAKLDAARAEFEAANADRAEDIRKLNEERLPGLEEALANGLAEYYEASEVRAQELADSAVVRAATEAQTKYDELQAAANAAQDRADQVAAEVGETSEAAQQARAEAEAAAAAAQAAQARADQVAAETGEASEAARQARAEAESAQTAANAAQARADQVAAEAGEASEAARQARAEAEAAQAAAQAAANAAQAAHDAAGSATALAQSAYDRAGTQGSILGGITGPAGTAAEGSYWIRWSSAGMNGQPVAVWRYDDGRWVSQSIDPAFAPVIDIGFGTVGTLQFQRLIGVAIQAQHLAVGDFSNLILDPRFEDDGWWRYEGFTRVNASVSRGAERRYGVLQLSGGTSSAPSGSAKTPPIPAKPRTKYVAEWESEFGGNRETDSEFHFKVYALNAVGERIEEIHSASYSLFYSFTAQKATFEIPAIPAMTHWEAEWSVSNMPRGRLMLIAPSILRRVAGVMIDENGIKSPQVDTLEFFGANAVIDRLSVAVARAMEITAERGFIGGVLLEEDAVTTRELRVTEEMSAAIGKFLRLEVGWLATNEMVGFLIRGGTIEGPLIRTSANWSSSGGAVIRADGSQGNIVTTDNTGMVTMRAGGSRHEFRGDIYTSNTTGDRRFIVSPTGWTLERDVGDGDWSTISMLGTTAEGDRLSMVDANGETGFSADPEGHVAARVLETDNDVLIEGDRLVGDLLSWEHPAARFQTTGVLDGLGRGVVAYGRRDVGSYSATHVRMTPMRLQIPNLPRRRFIKVEVSPLWVDTRGGEVRAFLTVGNRSTGAPGSAPFLSAATGALSSLGDVVSTVSSHREFGSDNRVMMGPMHWYTNTQAADENWTIDFHMTSVNGFTILPTAGNRLLEIVVTDLGPAVDNSGIGIDHTGGNTLTGGSVPAPPPTWVTRSRTYTPGNFRNWAADGRILGGSGASTSLPVERNMFQGQIPGSSFGYVRSAAFFGNHWGVPANARMISGSVRARWSHTYNGSGALARFMRHNVATTPTNRPTLNTLGTAHASRGGTAVYNLSSQQLDWMRGTSPAIRGFGLGDGSGGIGAYAYGANMEVRLRWEEQA